MTTTKMINKIGDKIVKINESFTINRYDNGFMIEAGGRNKKGDYVTSKILCSSLEEILELVKEASLMELDS